MEKNNFDERVNREFISHTEKDILGESYKLKDKFSHIWVYPSRKRLFGLMDSFTTNLSGKIVLDYGCGRGEESLKYLKSGAKKVYGIDISPIYIQEAHKNAIEAGYNTDKFEFISMDAHKLLFEDSMFDLVIGCGILHHLEPNTALDEIYRVLKNDGRVVLQEPLADNPLLKIFRKFTPNARTEDEAPFTNSQIKGFLKKNKWKSEIIYCGIIEAPVAMLTSLIIPNKPNNFLLKFADFFEVIFHKTAILNSWNQYVLFNMKKK